MERQYKVHEKTFINIISKHADVWPWFQAFIHVLFQGTIENQREVLDFYKILTSVTVEKVVEDEDGHSLAVYDKFRCSVKTVHSQGME